MFSRPNCASSHRARWLISACVGAPPSQRLRSYVVGQQIRFNGRPTPSSGQGRLSRKVLIGSTSAMLRTSSAPCWIMSLMRATRFRNGSPSSQRTIRLVLKRRQSGCRMVCEHGRTVGQSCGTGHCCARRFECAPLAAIWHTHPEMPRVAKQCVNSRATLSTSAQMASSSPVMEATRLDEQYLRIGLVFSHGVVSWHGFEWQYALVAERARRRRARAVHRRALEVLAFLRT